MTTKNFSERESIRCRYQKPSPCLKSLNICDGKHLLYSPDYNTTFSFSQLMSSVITQCFEELLDLRSVFLTLYSRSWADALLEGWSELRLRSDANVSPGKHLFSQTHDSAASVRADHLLPNSLGAKASIWAAGGLEQFKSTSLFCHTSIYRDIFASFWALGGTQHPWGVSERDRDATGQWFWHTVQLQCQFPDLFLYLALNCIYLLSGNSLEKMQVFPRSHWVP